tara:strand:+ start:35700 stop:40622 length:4923 start_codon:yes stop_codon:yes gene_type:complete
MSYTGYEDFLLINNEINIDNMIMLFKKKDILTDLNCNNNSIPYIDNLLSKESLDITINNQLKDKIVYYIDNFDVYKKSGEPMIDIDFSFYANENIKKYMFFYDFMSEYYRNLANLKKIKYSIDNKSLYSNEFEMKVRYIIKKTIDNRDYIININNTNRELDYYVVKLKLDTDDDITNLDELSQPNGKYKNLSIDSNYIDSFKSLFDKIIKDKYYFEIDKEKSDYYSLLSLSYKYKYEKNKLNYYIAKTIYFYFISKYKTKVEEINNIILIDFPIIFENFNKIINEDTNESFLKVIKNTKQKKFEYDKKIKKSIDEKAKQIALLIKGKEKKIDNLRKNKNNYTLQELDSKIETYEKDFNSKIEQINDEREILLNNRYINREESRVNEAIEYKQNLQNINDNIENNKDKFNKINKQINTDRNYINIVSIIIYISVFLLITLFVILGLSSVIGGSNINISIPITFIIISIILYIIINNYIGNNKNLYTKTYQKPNILNKIYNSFGLDLFEKFIDEDSATKTDLKLSMSQEQIDKLDPIVKDLLSKSNVGDNFDENDANGVMSTVLEDSVKDKIENDSTRKILVTIPTSVLNYNYAIDLYKEHIINTDTFELIHDLSVGEITHQDISLSDWSSIEPRNVDKQEISVPIIKNLFNQIKSLAFVNNNNDIHTVYTLKIPKGIERFEVTALVIGGGSFGGHIAPKEEFDKSQKPPVQNMGEGGAGGAVIAQKLILMEGEYEIGVGRGGSWLGQDLLAKAIDLGQATCSYIKNKTTNQYLILAQGAEYINYGNQEQYNLQLSGGTKFLETGVINDPLITPTNIIKNIALSSNNIGNKDKISSGGRGGLVIPATGQRGYTLITEFGANKDTFYLSGSSYDNTKFSQYSTSGNLGVQTDSINDNNTYNFQKYINGGYVAGGGGAASFCERPLLADEEDVSQNFFKLGEYYYTCISNSTTTFGVGGLGGGGDGSGLDYGKHGLLSTGAGGGGGKFRGGNGGSGLILLKFDHEVLKQNMDDLISLEVKRLMKSIYDIKTLNTGIEIKKERANLLELGNEINRGKQEINDKYIELGVKLETIDDQDNMIAEYNTLISEAETEQNRLKTKINAYEAEIQKYDTEILNSGAETELSKKQIEDIKTTIELQKEQLAQLTSQIEESRRRKSTNEIAVEGAKAKYIAQVAIKLEAEACKKALFAAETAKRRQLLDKQKLEKEIYDEMVKEADKAQKKAEDEAVEAERVRDIALADQKAAEEDYKKSKNKYAELLSSTELKESEKGYLLSLKLAIDYRIAGINIKENSKLYDNLNEIEKTKMQRNLEYEKQKRDRFVNDIICELTSSLNNIENGKGVMSSRFSINRISSGDLKLRAHVETPQEKEDREKDELLRNYEQSAYVNEETFANFSVTEHFNTSEELTTNIFRKNSQSYIPPDNITVIDIEIFAHPQLLKPHALDVLQEITKQLKDLNSSIRNSRYLRYTRAYKTSLNEDIRTIYTHTDKKWIEVKKESNLLSDTSILENNNNLIDSIDNIFDKIEKSNIDDETYYDNVNPLVKKEYKKYRNYENNSNVYLKMVENSTNVKLYDIRLKETIANYVITLCLLLSIYIFIAKFYNNIFILIVFAIIILIFTTIFFTEIYEIVYTKSDKNYWPKSKL